MDGLECYFGYRKYSIKPCFSFFRVIELDNDQVQDEGGTSGSIDECGRSTVTSVTSATSATGTVGTGTIQGSRTQKQRRGPASPKTANLSLSSRMRKREARGSTPQSGKTGSTAKKKASAGTPVTPSPAGAMGTAKRRRR